MSDKNASNINNNNSTQNIVSPSSVRVGSNGKKHSIDDIIDHMTADLQSYDGQYIVLGSPHNNPQHTWSEFNSNNNNRGISTANPVVNHGTQPAPVSQVQVPQVVGNHPIFLQQSSAPPPQLYELRDHNVDFQTQCGGGLFYTNPARVQDGTSAPGAGGEMIGMVDVGGGNFVNVVFNTAANPHSQLHSQYATTTNMLPQHQTAIPQADNSAISYIYQQHQQALNNSNQLRDYGLFSKETPASAQQPNRQLIENLVGNWLPNQSGTYSPFGSTAGRPAHSVDNGDNLGVHLNNSNNGVTTSSGVTTNNGTNRKPRVVAEVRPMRPTYSDVLTKSPPQINNNSNNNNNNNGSSAKIPPNSLASNTTQSGNTTPKSESRKHNNKTNKSGGNKENSNNAKNNTSNLRRQHSSGSDDNSSSGSRLMSNIHKWMSIEELTPPHSGSEQNYDHHILDDGLSGVNYDNDGISCKRTEKKQKKRSTKQKVNDEKIESLSSDKVGGISYVNNNSSNSNNNNSNLKRSMQMNNNLLRNRSNPDKNLSKASKKGINKEDSKVGLGSITGTKRTQRSGKRRNCQTYLGVLWSKWQHYTLLFATWFFNLLWDVLALSSRLFIHLVAVSFEYTLSMLHCSKVYIYGIFGNKPNGNFSNSNSNSRFKNGHHDHMNGSSKGSWWKFWDRNKKPLRPEKPHNTGGLTNNMAIPTTGDEAIRRLLSCKGKDPYSILGVTRHCTDDDIKKYYKRQAVLVHPDKNSQPGAEEAFKILVHAFELIGEPERRSRYDHCVAETHQMEHAWTELNDLLTQLHQKMEYTANTIRCTNCGKRHRRVSVQRPCYAARFCAQCKIHHSAREGDIWAESWIIGFVWHYYACMEGQIYNITEWATCQAENLQHLKANSHAVQYRIVLGKQHQHQHEPQQNQQQTPPPQQPRRQSEPDLEEFLNNLYSQSNTNSMNQGSSDVNTSRHRRKTKRKK